MCVFMSPGRLSWLHKIELVISNISSPKGDWVGEEEQGELGMVASCQQGTSLRDSERERGREREMHEAVTLMSLRIKSMAVQILNEHGLKRRSTRQAQNQIKPTRYRSLCSLLVSGDAFSASVRMGGGFLMKTDYNRIPNTCER